MVQISDEINLPASKDRNGITDITQRKISPSTIILDKGTATKFVSKKKFGN
jgi:hypothetical protein